VSGTERRSQETAAGGAGAGRRLIVEADGGSRGNPGPAGYGAVVRDAGTGEVLAERAGALGSTTNNVAEYQGLLAGLRAAAEFAPSAVEARLDSKLVVEQMSGRWKVRHAHLQPLAAEAAALVRSLGAVRFTWVPRARNSHADRLANEAMDAAARGGSWQRQSEVDSPVRTSTGTGWSVDRPPPTRMLLLRHGETKYSVDLRMSGRGDLPLTARGRAQAEAAARRIGALGGIAAIVTSPLGRARETAEAVAAVTGLHPVVDDGLVETDFGEWEGLTFAEVYQRWPAEADRWRGSAQVAPPGGESFAAVARRVRRSRDRTIAAYPGQSVVVVSHVTPIKTLLQLGLDAGPGVLFRLHLDIASLSIVDWHADGQASVRLVNDIGHLHL
jgi:ribonuclease H / adenosylcobalamin/alpha-ribazole phosphatase